MHVRFGTHIGLQPNLFVHSDGAWSWGTDSDGEDDVSPVVLALAV